MPKKVSLRAVRVAPQEGGAAFAVCQQFVNASSTLTPFTSMGVEAAENGIWAWVAGMSALRIDAGEKCR